MHAVTTPIGTSAGACTVRATRSAPIRNAGTEHRHRHDHPVAGPAVSRTVWATMMPTKPIRPLTDTAAAVPSVAAPTTMSRVRAGWMPSVPASSSPTRSTSSMRRWAISTAPLTRT